MPKPEHERGSQTPGIEIVPEPAVDPHRRIVDSHHHLWDRGGSTYLAGELLADTTATHNITHTVFVDCMSKYETTGPIHLQPVGETRFVAQQAAEIAVSGRTKIAAIVSFADMTLGFTTTRSTN